MNVSEMAKTAEGRRRLREMGYADGRAGKAPRYPDEPSYLSSYRGGKRVAAAKT